MRWAYIRETWDFGSTIEIEEKHTGRYGARGQEREEKRRGKPPRRRSPSRISGEGREMSED